MLCIKVTTKYPQILACMSTGSSGGTYHIRLRPFNLPLPTESKRVRLYIGGDTKSADFQGLYLVPDSCGLLELQVTGVVVHLFFKLL